MNNSIALLLCVLSAAPASALTITDANTSDDNVITEWYNVVDGNGSGIIPSAHIFENYGETNLIPYPSHDGYAVVNETGGFFDKIISKDGSSGIWDIFFHVTNIGPFNWSDYHFEYYEPAFILPLSQAVDGTGGPLLTGNPLVSYYSDIFQNSAVNGAIPSLDFFSPGFLSPGATGMFHITVDLDVLPDTYGVRQIATAVPLPGAAWLLCIGLAGLLGVRKRNK